MQGTNMSKLVVMNYHFELQKPILGNQSKSLMFCPLKRNKRCWHKQCVNLCLQLVWISYLDILTCELLFIKRCFELCNMDFDEYSLHNLLIGVILQLCQGKSKNWRIDVTRCFVDWHHLFVVYFVIDVIETYKEIAWWCPICFNDKPRPHPLFLWVKLKWPFFDEIWFSTSFIGQNQLRLILNILIFYFPNSKGKVLSNKNCHVTGITPMEERFVP